MERTEKNAEHISRLIELVNGLLDTIKNLTERIERLE